MSSAPGAERVEAVHVCGRDLSRLVTRDRDHEFFELWDLRIDREQRGFEVVRLGL